ncbi:uncharacterized protein DDB_G0271670-like [Daktulosphaira vitifoliae]|uniref:uncharacterized protein DDB_G0271670-like n=1 Tax=Daktulosphaira vitifoliae TaxID=58002 RepID=UPI0021AA2119|nr:uncharacterized protein DDB_G0271670-like [Daktulosphaira vitifoliae]
MYKEAIEIEKCPENFNREDGWTISKTWLPIIHQTKRKSTNNTENSTRKSYYQRNGKLSVQKRKTKMPRMSKTTKTKSSTKTSAKTRYQCETNGSTSSSSSSSSTSKSTANSSSSLSNVTPVTTSSGEDIFDVFTAYPEDTLSTFFEKKGLTELEKLYTSYNSSKTSETETAFKDYLYEYYTNNDSLDTDINDLKECETNGSTSSSSSSSSTSKSTVSSSVASTYFN